VRQEHDGHRVERNWTGQHPVDERPGERRNGGRGGSGFCGAIASSASASGSVPGATGVPCATGIGPLPGISSTRYSGSVTSSFRFNMSRFEWVSATGCRFSTSWARWRVGSYWRRRRSSPGRSELMQDAEAERAEREDCPAEPGRQALGGIEDRIAALGPEQLREGDDRGVLLRNGGFGGECVRPVGDAHQHIGDHDDGHKSPRPRELRRGAPKSRRAAPAEMTSTAAKYGLRCTASPAW